MLNRETAVREGARVRSDGANAAERECIAISNAGSPRLATSTARRPSSRDRSSVLRLYLLVAILAGCADREPPERAATPPPRALDVQQAFRSHLGRTWELESLGDQVLPASPAGRVGRKGRYPGGGTRPTIRFTDTPASEGSVHPPGTLLAGGWGVCNGYGTAYALGAGGAIRFHGFGSTLVGCNGPDSLESRFFRGLYETRRLELDSTRLTLITEDGGRLGFVLVPDSALRAGR